MAGGVAHEFNNILTSVIGYSELLKGQFEKGPVHVKKAFDVIISESTRAVRLTQQLLGFARGGKYNPEELVLYKVIEEAVNVIEMIKVNPEIKVLVMSGYSHGVKAREILDLGANGFLKKPFNIKELSQGIRDILDN